jgi:hypothetical protein
MQHRRKIYSFLYFCIRSSSRTHISCNIWRLHIIWSVLDPLPRNPYWWTARMVLILRVNGENFMWWQCYSSMNYSPQDINNGFKETTKKDGTFSTRNLIECSPIWISLIWMTRHELTWSYKSNHQFCCVWNKIYVFVCNYTNLVTVNQTSNLENK